MSVRIGAAEGKGISGDDESMVNRDADGKNSRPVVQEQHFLQRYPQQQLQGPTVRWERFLPVRSLRVLLVETDDSTRHVVSALLSNCSYEVTAVSGGPEAWKILEDSSNHIDLVLTEVEMPSLSGIGLLASMMNHKSCKNIPLIMMSSNDSMGIVFKCLSKGAVDFLVKPIRKNELKNLWQHVWRKCHSCHSSGSESGIRIQNNSKSSVEVSDNNTGSNGDDVNWSTGLNVKDGSDNGSGTQNSWSERMVEVEKSRAVTLSDRVGGPADSTCAQVCQSRSRARGCNKEEVEHENVTMGKYLETAILKNPDASLEQPFRKESKKDNEESEKRIVEVNNEAVKDNSRMGNSDYMCVITNSSNPQIESVPTEDTLSKIINTKDKNRDENNALPSLELDLNKPIDDAKIKRNILRHSDLSAFSRYNITSSVNGTPTGNVGSCSPPDNSSEAEKTKMVHNLESNSLGTPNQICGNSNNDDMGSSTNNNLSKPVCDKQKATSLVNAHPSFQLFKDSDNSSMKPELQGLADTGKAQERTAHRQVQVQHHHHHYHHHHHHVHDMNEKEQLTDHNSLSFKSNASASHFGSSNVANAPIEGNAANFCMNGSASGSNNRSGAENGSSGQNANNIAGTVEGTVMAGESGGSRKCGGEDLHGSGRKSGLDQNQSAQRAAALHKFREKRKDRCFDKKVRYHNRKKLAEQRPRVKGQFVRQAVVEDKISDPNS
ncbi:hypothetical protein DCAR_0415535 [Daucus carota subsp. sativus]|uniref:Uncharacterized protein n=1 Tax=Daucus carota subsp. sativus TaxID=79200 RepID=A0A165WDN5_DAUCS|nr:PREDICTED: two-component response regulator-like APRR3 [Daucus carota subsp. sativus]XP_017247282.1 PREDICTED: two-component response regulator-like APRR3 [Daucus carota subsp. sativus]WOG96202.1 hypothetical protein DCAR_0415535 [Daucus carota subsp. sativus]